MSAEYSAASSTSLTRLEEIERAKRLAETIQVLSQPHRKGDASDMTDPLGLFVRIHKCGRECYDAGWDYYRLVYRWRRAKGIPNPVRLDEISNAAAGELETSTVDEWGAKIKACENALKCAGLFGFNAAQALLLDAVFPEERAAGPVKRALHRLAIELGKFPF